MRFRLVPKTMTLDDLEPQNKDFLLTFVFAMSGCDSHLKWIVPKSHRPRVKPEQAAYEIFSIKRRFQQSKSRTPLQKNLRTQASKMGAP